MKNRQRLVVVKSPSSSTPGVTRPKLIRALEMLKDKTDSNPPKKHGNIAL